MMRQLSFFLKLMATLGVTHSEQEVPNARSKAEAGSNTTLTFLTGPKSGEEKSQNLQKLSSRNGTDNNFTNQILPSTASMRKFALNNETNKMRSTESIWKFEISNENDKKVCDAYKIISSDIL